MKTIKISIISGLVALFAITSSYAGEEPELGFSGELFLGGLYSRGDLPLDDPFEDDNQTISSLDLSPKKSSEASFLMDGRLRYLFSTGTMVGVGAMGGPNLNMEGGYGIKVSQDAGDLGRFSLTATHSETDVWADPFLIGKARSKTDQKTIGVSLVWEDFLDTDFSLGYGYEDFDVENDLAGQMDSRLKRAGRAHHLGFSYGLFNNGSHEMLTNLIGEIGDMEGKSYSFKGGELDLSHIYHGGGWEIETDFSIGKRDFDEVHSKFGKEREDMKYTIGTAYTLFNPFGFEHYFLSVFGSYDRVDSNINFYDKDVWSAGAGVGISF